MESEADELRVGGKIESAAQTVGKAVLLILLVSAQTSHAYPDSSLLLRYDDGGAECFWSDYYPNGMAVEFCPPSLKWRITAVLIYGFAILKDEKTFIIEVRDNDFNVVFKVSIPIPNYFKNATLDWAKVILPGVIVEGNFYVCVYPMLEPNETQLWIAIDNDTISDRSFLVDCYRQEMRKLDGKSVMIRVKGEEATDLAEIILDSISVEKESLRILFRVIATSNVTEVSAALQTGSLTEDCEVMHRGELYEVTVNWPKLSGLKEPAGLILRSKTLNSTTNLVIKLGETLFSEYLRLRDENWFLRAMLNNSREQETLRHMLEGKEADITIMKASLEAYEKKQLREAGEVEKLAQELNLMRLLMGFLGLSMILLFIVLGRKSHASSASTGGEEVGGNA
ncbi:MAG: hypothetical protein FGF51_06845 [Candidatus Brockarchaeota archaeon]|nr:hypothetical protein [Candidatus Brockarchaeota archaeon]